VPNLVRGNVIKIDVVMWVKNGQELLPLTLDRIEKVIPSEIIREKIFVDDHSSDESVRIAKGFGWRVYENEGRGISAAANTALKKVSTNFFISIEQDLLLAEDWWRIMQNHLPSLKTPVVQGVRVPSHPVLAAIERYYIEREIPYVSIDNNIYLTEVIKSFGGFPKSTYAVDSLLKEKLESKGYNWKVVKDAVSLHIRKGGLKEELIHQYRYGTMSSAFYKNIPRFLFSPMRGFLIARKYKQYRAVIYYPAMRLANLIGTFKNCLRI
jgi:glycosyltransferase involved in cell wall biosynthesis